MKISFMKGDSAPLGFRELLISRLWKTLSEMREISRVIYWEICMKLDALRTHFTNMEIPISRWFSTQIFSDFLLCKYFIWFSEQDYESLNKNSSILRRVTNIFDRLSVPYLIHKWFVSLPPTLADSPRNITLSNMKWIKSIKQRIQCFGGARTHEEQPHVIWKHDLELDNIIIIA